MKYTRTCYTYCGVLGPEVLQSQEVFVEKTLGQAIEDDNVHPCYVLLMMEMTPTERRHIHKRAAFTTGGWRCLGKQEAGGNVFASIPPLV